MPHTVLSFGVMIFAGLFASVDRADVVPVHSG